MDNDDALQTYLQTYLANEVHSVTFLPAILSGLSSCDVENSAHLLKWINKVNSLIHSKDAGIRWAGLCLALKTSQRARSVLLSSGPGWVTVVLPLLSKTDNCVTYKAAIRLLCFIFITTTELPEFQRQVVTPNIPKFSGALISLTEKFADLDLKAYCMDVLTVLVQKFPSLHRPLAPQLSSMSLSFLNGAPTSPTPERLMKSACRLHACLHHTGGKVGGSALWRKSMDETIVFCNESLTVLRSGPSNPGQYGDDPMMFTNFHVDRLHCGIELLCCLLSTPVSRPVLVPIKSIVTLCLELFNASSKETSNDIDPSFKALAASSRTHTLEMASKLMSVVSICIGKNLGPEHSKLLSVIAFNLEQPLPTCQRLPLVRLLPALLGSCFHPADALVAGRVIKTLLPTIGQLFSQKTSVDSASSQLKGNKKTKKRVQGYEGDEMFKTGRDAIFSSPEDGELLICSLDALPYLLRTPDLPEYLQSLTSRILLSLLILLPTVTAASISSDLALHGRISSRVKEMTLELASASGSILSKSLPLVVAAIGSDIDSKPQSVHERLVVDLMLHPRLPPLLRPLPHLNEIALTSAEEGEEVKKTRVALGLTDAHEVSTRGAHVENSAVAAAPMDEDRVTEQSKAVQQNPSTVGSIASVQATPSVIPSVLHAQNHKPPQPTPEMRMEETPRAPIRFPTSSSTTETDTHTESSQTRTSLLKANVQKDTEEPLDIRAPVETTIKLIASPVEKPPLAHDVMMVDDDEDDEDIVIPPLSLATDSESDE